MKTRLIFPAVTVLFFLAACVKREPVPEDYSTGRTAVLAVRLSGEPRSKAAPGACDTDTAADLSVFVFNADGSLDNSARTDGNSLSLPLSPDAGKHLYVLVNSPESVMSLSSETELQALTTSLSAHTSGHFPMQHRETIDLSGSEEVEVEVKRIAVQVRIDRITNRSGHSLTVKALYLTNAVTGGVPWFSPDTFTPGEWAHPMRYESSPLDAFLYQQIASGAITDGGHLDGPHVFYACPNPTPTDTRGGTAWSARKTRLVIEAEMEGITYWYPFTFDNFLANHRYVITNLNITRPGSRHPDIPVDPRALEAAVSVREWSSPDVAYTDPL